MVSGLRSVSGRDHSYLKVRSIHQAMMNSSAIIESENKALFDIITMPGENHQLTYLHEPKSKLDQTPQLITHEFKFSHSFDETMSNRDVYQRAIQGMIKRVLTSGGKATVFAYGQTGSGKSYMVFGDGQPNGQEGVFQYTAREILDTYGHFHLSISFYEIYGPKIYDLLNNRQEVQFFEGNPGKNGTGPLMPDLMEQDVESVEDLMKYLKTASKYRSTSATDANEQSSRSHAIFNLNVRFNNDGDVKPSNRKDQKQGDLKPPHASVSIIDLAGSEKASEANVKDQKLKIESGEINKSLLALKECIRALQDNDTQHVPFRQSKLTMVLRDSLEASSDSQEGLKEVVMVATIRPTNQVAEHTMNTLRYADRVQSFNGKQSERVVDTDVYSPMDLVRAKAASENHSSKPKQRHVDEMEEVVSTPKPSPNKTGTNPISKSESVAWSAASSAIADAHMAVLADLHALLKLEQEELVGSDVLDSSDYMEYLRRLDAFAEQKAELIKNFQARVRNEMNESK